MDQSQSRCVTSCGESLTKPLEGLMVLEVANWIAGPCCGALLADLGATVVKVEPPQGDSMRYIQRQPASDSPTHLAPVLCCPFYRGMLPNPPSRSITP